MWRGLLVLGECVCKVACWCWVSVCGRDLLGECRCGRGFLVLGECASGRGYLQLCECVCLGDLLVLGECVCVEGLACAG